MNFPKKLPLPNTNVYSKMAGGCSIIAFVTLALLAAKVKTVSSGCYCTETSTNCNDLDGEPFMECANSFALYIVNSSLDALRTSNLAHLPNLKTFAVEDSWSVEELPIDLLEPLVKIQNIHIINTSAFSRVEDMLYNNLEVTSLVLISNNISKIESRVFQKLSRLREIDLSNNMIAAINSSPLQKYGPFSNLTELRFLNLRENKISHIQKNAFACKQNIIKLDISSNEIEEIDQGAFCLDGIHKVTLNISQNKLKHLLDETFTSCNAVTYLDLSLNQIEDLHPGAFRGLTKCKGLNLNNNYLREVSSSVFSPLESLQDLDLKENKMEKLLGDQFGASTTLRVLNLSGNEITRIHPKTFRGLASLEKLNLEKNKLVDLGNSFSEFLPNLSLINITNNNLLALNHSSFRGCAKLKTLDLSGNAISEIEGGAFLNNTFLESLLLNNNYLSCIKCNSFKGLSSLKNLFLGENILDSLSYPSFYHLNNLKRLFLYPSSENPCSCTSILKLKNANVYVDIENEELNSLCGDYRYMEKVRVRENNETCCCSYETCTPVPIHEKDTINVTDVLFTHVREYELPNNTEVYFEGGYSTLPTDEEFQRVEETQQDNHSQITENTGKLEKPSFYLDSSTLDLGVNSTKTFMFHESVKNQSSSHEAMQNGTNIFQNKNTSSRDDEGNKILRRNQSELHYQDRSEGNISETNPDKLLIYQEQNKQKQLEYPENKESYEYQQLSPEQNEITVPQSNVFPMIYILAVSVVVAGLVMLTIFLGLVAPVIYKKWRLRGHVYEEISSSGRERNDAQMVLRPPGMSV